MLGFWTLKRPPIVLFEGIDTEPQLHAWLCRHPIPRLYGRPMGGTGGALLPFLQISKILVRRE